jgi:hypothetical protein
MVHILLAGSWFALGKEKAAASSPAWDDGSLGHVAEDKIASSPFLVDTWAIHCFVFTCQFWLDNSLMARKRNCFLFSFT